MVEHTDGYVGEVAKSAQVVTNDPANQSFNLLVRAYFKTLQPSGPAPAIALAGPGKVAGPFTVSPSDRWVTSILTGSSSTGRISFYNGSGSPVRIKQVIPGGANFTAALEAIEEGKRYEITVATNPALKPGQYHQTMKVLTDSKAAPEMEIELAVTVYPKVFVMPTMLNLSPPQPGADSSEMSIPPIYVRKLREGGLKVNNVSSTLPFLSFVVATETEGQTYTVTVRIDKSKVTTPGEFKGKIRIETNDPDSPVLEVPVQGSFN